LLKRPYTKNYYTFKDRIGIGESVDLIKKPELILDSLIQVGKLKRINGLDFKPLKKYKNLYQKLILNIFYYLRQELNFYKFLGHLLIYQPFSKNLSSWV
jgi:hypothetical protein